MNTAAAELLPRPRKVVLTCDAVGGVWSYALETAALLDDAGIGCMLVGLGPPPSNAQLSDARRRAPAASLDWIDLPLDWMTDDEASLSEVGPSLALLARFGAADLVHVSAPTQAAGLVPGLAVVAHAHSCVPTWWAAVKGGGLPESWSWQGTLNRAGLQRADVLAVPTASHGQAMRRSHGRLPAVEVVSNSIVLRDAAMPMKSRHVLAVGRWWDEGKNAAILDQAAQASPWPILLAGALTGPNGASCKVAHARALGLLGPDDMADRISRAAVFAAPSLYEPFGLAVLEAAGRSAALLLSDIPSFRELWQDAALFVDPRDAAAWSLAIERLAGDEPLRLRLGIAARQRAARFDRARQRAGLFQAYAGALGSRGNAMRSVA